MMTQPRLISITRIIMTLIFICLIIWPMTSFSHVKDVELKSDNLKVEGEEVLSTTLRGTYVAPPGWSLSINNEKVMIGENHEFTVTVELKYQKTRLEIIATGPQNEVERKSVYLRVKGAGEDAEKTAPKIKPTVVAGISMTTISHKESALDPYSALATTGKISINYPLSPPKWDLGVTAFGTLFSITKSHPEEARYIGLNARVGYLFPYESSSSWRFGLYGGLYYTTMIVNDGTFGFTNMKGPQIYPTVRKILDDGHSIAAYAKVSPVSGGFLISNTINREVATGFAYIIPDRITRKHQRVESTSISALIFNLDIAQIKLLVNEITILTTTVSFGVSHHL